MGKYERVVHRFQDLLQDPVPLSKAEGFCEDFASRRFFKKMEKPDQTRARERSAACFRDFLENDARARIPIDHSLPGVSGIGYLSSKWYKARHAIHRWCRDFRVGEPVFTTGSEAFGTRGFNSIESKLTRSVWGCPPKAFEFWARTAFRHSGLKRAARRRFHDYIAKKGLSRRAVYRRLWRKYSKKPNAAFRCFRIQLWLITKTCLRNRFSTVRKNNEVDRPICLEPFVAMLLQRRIGVGLRRALLLGTGRDIDALADIHRLRIGDSMVATIDLTSASDFICLDLCRFLFPKGVYDLLMRTRMPLMVGLDGGDYSLRKLATMGNGYCFDVMSVILTAIAMEHDSDATVFGDDIIVSNSAAPGLVRDLGLAGLVVNEEKSCIDSKYRESCGANYHDDYGYIESYDFIWPENIHDCIVLHNKAFALGEVYPSFHALYLALTRLVPWTLKGPVPLDQGAPHLVGGGNHAGARAGTPNVDFSTYFWAHHPKRGLRVRSESVLHALKSLHLPTKKNVRFFTGWVYRPKQASRLLRNLYPSKHMGKILMYLHAGRKITDDIRGSGLWQPVTLAQVGQRAFRLKALVSRPKGAP